MARYIFDIETNGFLENVTQLHCVTSQDIETGEFRQSSSRNKADMMAHVRELEKADELIGHNIIKYDVPVLDKLVGFKPKGKITDTLICTRLIWPDIAESDFKRVRSGKLPSKLTGAHSLEAWGYRLGEMKGEYGKDENGKDLPGKWDELNDSMLSYNLQDVVVNRALWDRVVAKEVAPMAMDMEHRFATIIAMQERHGFSFNEELAYALYAKLAARRTEIQALLKATFPARWVAVEEKTPTRTIRYFREDERGTMTLHKKAWKRGYYETFTAGEPYTKIEWKEFNPSSRQQIAERLQELGWVPTEFTPAGQPKVDETTLEKLEHPSAQILGEYFLVEKRIGQLAEGDQAWLKLVRKGRIHGSVNTLGAITGRCTHSNPNVAQVPSVGAIYGAECRELFRASAGMVQVGADASGLELRCLAHYMARYDGGKFSRILLEGDIHWANVQAMGLTDQERDESTFKIHKIFRNGAKTFIYGFLYGAGDVKIGSIVLTIVADAKKFELPYEAISKAFFGKVTMAPTEEELKKAGGRLKRSFLKKTPALRKLRDAVAKAAEKGTIKGIDGRILKIRHAHAALNTLLQSAGALIVKMATVLAYDELSTRGYVFGKDWALIAHVHDEMQCEARKEIADEVGQVLVQSMRRAGDVFGFRVPIDGEYKVGANWRDCH